MYVQMMLISNKCDINLSYELELHYHWWSLIDCIKIETVKNIEKNIAYMHMKDCKKKLSFIYANI